MADQRDTVLDIAVAVNSATSLDGLIRVVMQRVGELMPYDRASIALHDPSTSRLEVQDLSYASPEEGAPDDRGKQIPVDESNVLGWVFLHGEPHCQTGHEAKSRFQTQAGREMQSHIVAPLIAREDTLGVLNIGSYSAGAFREEDVATFSGYARLAAIAIENYRNYDRARESSIRDGLTGAFNHRHMKEVVESEISRAGRYGAAFSLILLDIDHFKSFNDRFGHQAGDNILAQTVHILQENLRPSDLVFRYGGEEFAVLLPSTPAEQACIVAAKLLDRLRELNLFRPDRSTVHRVTASAGVATMPDDAGTRDAILACADQALYRAKSLGRNRWVAFPRISEVRKVEDELAARAGLLPDALLADEPGDSFPDCANARVIAVADLLARDVGLGTGQRINLRIAAFYHNIGEAGIPRELLERDGPLDARERSLVKAHPVVGESLLSRILQVGEVLLTVLHHQERFDGTGVPHGLAGERIPLLARVLAVAVIFDALTSSRPYRKAYTVREAYDLMRDMSSFELDPGLVDRFLAAHSAQAQAGGSI